MDTEKIEFSIEGSLNNIYNEGESKLNTQALIAVQEIEKFISVIFQN